MAGSGKSHLALMYSLAFKEDPNFRAVYIRGSSVQIRQSGGLWDESQKMYKPFRPKVRQDVMSITFPSGATVQFKTLGADREISNFDGGQYSLVCFDECQWHSQEQVMYLLSRIRSQAKGPHKLIATCNPHPDSFLLKFVSWYLDQDTGIPIAERSGKTRYFSQYRGEIVFADTPKEMLEKYPGTTPMTYTFIAANIYSNPVLMERDPEYVRRLENLKRSERDRLLLGSWFARETASKYWKREWVEMVDYPASDAIRRVRAWDLAATLPSEVNKDPDYTCSVLVSRNKYGVYTVEDAYRFRKLSGDVLDEIVATAKADGIDEVQVMIPGEIGAGRSWSQHVIRVLSENGIPARLVQISGHKGKITRFLPFASMCESGSVKFVKGDWNDWVFTELESFDGGRKGHDDAVDCCADAFATLAKSSVLPMFILPEMTKQSPLVN